MTQSVRAFRRPGDNESGTVMRIVKRERHVRSGVETDSGFLKAMQEKGKILTSLQNSVI